MRKILSLLSVVAVIGAFASGCASHKSPDVPYANSYPYPPRPFMVTPKLASDTYVGYSDGYIWPLVPGNQFVIFEMP
jgi:hypothetical protein